MNPLGILAIHAHPDDIEIVAGGTVAHLIDRGHRVTIVTMTPGDCGTTEYPAEEIARIRRQEAENGARLVGAEYICAEFRDLAVFSDDASRRRVTEVLRRVRPDIVLTASPVDYHCDHEATSMLVRDACLPPEPRITSPVGLKPYQPTNNVLRNITSRSPVAGAWALRPPMAPTWR